MPDFSQPVSSGVIIGSILFIFICIGIGLVTVEYYKKRYKKEERE